MGSSQQFSLRWNNYLKHITCAFDTLRTDEDLVDVTLSCEGKRIRAHKMLLSACSTYFRDLFKENPCQHPVIIFRNVKFDDLAALVDFMYQGEVNVVQEQLASFLTTAELLAVQGLTDGTGKDSDSIVEDDVEIPNEPEVQLQNAAGKPMTNSKGNKSPSSPLPFQSVDVQSEATPPTKRRKCRENRSLNADKSQRENNANTTKDSEKTTDNQANASGSDPVEIIPLMPNFKLEMPEYMEQDGSSCSYEEQNAGDSSVNKLVAEETTSNTIEHEHKPDISQTFYSVNQTDVLEGKRASTDIGHLLSKPGTSGERLGQEAAQDSANLRQNMELSKVERLKNELPDSMYQPFGGYRPPSLCCRLCGVTFTTQHALLRHIASKHESTPGDAAYCEICLRSFKTKWSLATHNSRYHRS
ncbi:protein bric-a-brac 2-like isoform X4 [Venturia canescens]|uniref:protein bric-a-brac 2-like isoform X4 n=1 Tax=Venturia canescens TaxID=32260 RepID=UPI001C9C8819|nr:protein bric-a-brac 2-like isoform X4 [Venturia canescens]